MKKFFTFFAFALITAGCSKQISYVGAYKFSKHTYGVKEGEEILPIPLIESNQGLQLTASTKQLRVEPPATLPTMRQLRLAAILAAPTGGSQVIHPADTTTKRAAKHRSAPIPSLNWAAPTGLILLLAGLLLTFITLSPMFILFLLPGALVSLIGLKSERRRLALVGVWLFLIVLILTIGTEIYLNSL